MANVQENTFYLGSVQYAAIATWVTGTASAGDICRQVSPSTGNERAFICIVGGAKGGVEPTWNVGRGNKTTDSSATWIECTAAAVLNGDFTQNWTWAKNQSVPLGVVITDNAGTHAFICTTTGTTGNGAEPSWSTGALGNTTVDNGVTWTYISLTSNISKFKVPHAHLFNAMNASGYMDGNGTAQNATALYVADNHAETSTNFSMSSRGDNRFPIDILCISHTGNIPPLSSADLATTATVTTQNSDTIWMASAFRWVYGITFSIGTSGNISFVLQNSQVLEAFYENCTFKFGSGVGGGGQFRMGQNGSTGQVRLKGCTFKFSNVGQCIAPYNNNTILDNCTVDGTGSIPTTLVSPAASGCNFLWKNSDLSNQTGNLVGAELNCPNRYEFADCKLGSATFDLRSANSNQTTMSTQLTLTRCSSGANNYQFATSTVAGYMIADNTIVRTGGASDSTTNFGWTVQTNASASGTPSRYRINWAAPFEFPTIAQYNSKLAANRTVTVYGIIFGQAGLPTNFDLWFDCEYLGTSGNPIGTLASTRAASTLVNDAVALTADSTSGWDSGATARQNTHAYSVGNVIKVASNPGRLFFCTASSGSSAGSEPGGYAGAVDGGTVTDGSCTFQAGVRFKMSLTLSAPQPQIAGNMYFTVKCTKGNTTLTIDPLVVLS